MRVSQDHFLLCAGKTIHVETWGDASHPPVVIWHGVTGTARDHEELALQLTQQQFYVICPDAIGCGLSDWPTDTEQPSLEFHVKLTDDMLKQLGIKETRWIGTSKGGALGMLYSATGSNCTISQLVLHDVGPGLPEKFRAGVARMLSQPPYFPTLEKFQAYLKKSLSKGGLQLPPEGWQRLAMIWHRRSDDGQFTYHHAPTLADQFIHHPQNFDLWNHYANVDSDILVIRGKESNVLTIDEAEQMASANDHCRLVTRSGGHISFLTSPEEQEIIFNFFSC